MDIKLPPIAIIGGGNIGRAIADGLLLSKEYPPEQLTVTRRYLASLKDLIDKGAQVHSDNEKAVEDAKVVILAVKPYNIKAILESISPELKPGHHILVSVATGISIAEMRKIAPTGLPIFRAMPNTAMAVQSSMTCICHEGANAHQQSIIQSIFDLCGQAIFIEESLMDAATVLAACGIAYALRYIRANMQGGIEIGFDSETALRIATQTVKGAAELLLAGKSHPEAEIDKVTTPKGCTIAGLNEMEHRGFSSSLIKGIVTSHQQIGS